MNAFAGKGQDGREAQARVGIELAIFLHQSAEFVCASTLLPKLLLFSFTYCILVTEID